MTAKTETQAVTRSIATEAPPELVVSAAFEYPMRDRDKFGRENAMVLKLLIFQLSRRVARANDRKLVSDMATDHHQERWWLNHAPSRMVVVAGVNTSKNHALISLLNHSKSRRLGVSVFASEHAQACTMQALFKPLIWLGNYVRRQPVHITHPDPLAGSKLAFVTPTRCAAANASDIPLKPVPVSFEEVSFRRILRRMGYGRNDETVAVSLRFQPKTLKSFNNTGAETVKRSFSRTPYTRTRMREVSIYNRFTVSEGEIAKKISNLGRNQTRNWHRFIVSPAAQQLNIGVYYAN